MPVLFGSAAAETVHDYTLAPGQRIRSMNYIIIMRLAPAILRMSLPLGAAITLRPKRTPLSSVFNNFII